MGAWLDVIVGPESTDANAPAEQPGELGSDCLDPDRPLAWWMSRLAQTDPGTLTALLEAGIRTDDDFTRQRGALTDSVRLRGDRHRFRSATESVALVDPFVLAPFLPDWAFTAPLSALGLSRRSMNVCLRAGLQTVADLLALGQAGIVEMRNFGRSTLRDLGERLYVFVSGREPDDSSQSGDFENEDLNGSLSRPPSEAARAKRSPSAETTVEPPALRPALDTALIGLRERHASALRLWLGMDAEPKILEDIGAVLGVTRERARQLRNRAWEDIRGRWLWPGEVVRRLEHLLVERQEPLFLDLLAAEDPWFDGFQENLTALGRLVEDLAGGELNVWLLDGRLIVSRCGPERWGQMADLAQAALEREIPTGVTRPDARLLVGAIAFTEGAPDLASTLWTRVESSLHFAGTAGGEERLVSIGRGMRHVIAAILNESDRPLHITEIVDRLCQRGFITQDNFGTRNMIRAAVRDAKGVLYGRSVYGFEQHLPISREVAEEALAEIEGIMLNGAAGRQWHCTELAEALAVRRPDFGEDLDQFVLNVVLGRSAIATYLGRLVWVVSTKSEDLQDRLDVAAMCEAALLRAGGPLSNRDLRNTIQQVRGLNQHFLPQASDRVIRLAHGMWGLVDRDVGVSAENQGAALDALYGVLSEGKKGLHVSELFAALAETGFVPDPELDHWELLGIAQSDARFRVGRGQIVGLAAWPNVRRRSIGQAMTEMRTGWPGAVTGEALYAGVCEMIERPIARAAVASHAARAGFIYDNATGLWDLAETEAEDADLVVGEEP